MKRSHSFQNLLDHTTLAPEVEAPPADTFGLAAVQTERRRDPELRPLFRWLLIPLCLASLAAITLRDHEVRHTLPPPPAVAVEPGAATALAIARSLAPGQSHCIQDWREGDCYRCAHRTESGDAVGGYAC